MEAFQAFFARPTTIRNIITSALIIGTLAAVRHLSLRVVRARGTDLAVIYQWRKTSRYLAFLIGGILLVALWVGGGFASYTATYFGLLSAGLAIALQSLIVNFVGWVFILWRRPLRIGDRIQIGEHVGDVIDVRIFQFLLMEVGNWVSADQSTGRIIYIPNGKVFSEALANYTRGFQLLWNEIPVLLTFESDWERGKRVLQAIAERHSADSSSAAEYVKQAGRQFLLTYSTLTPTVYTSVEASGVLLTIRYLCPPRQRRGSAQGIWEDILRAFADDPALELAYPTQRLYTLPQDAPPRLPNA